MVPLRSKSCNAQFRYMAFQEKLNLFQEAPEIKMPLTKREQKLPVYAWPEENPKINQRSKSEFNIRANIQKLDGQLSSRKQKLNVI